MAPGLRATEADLTLNFERMAGVGGVNRAEDVDFDVIAAGGFPTSDDVLTDSGTALVDAVGVVESPVAVPAETYGEVVFPEEFAAGIVQEGGIGFQCVPGQS